MKHLWENTDVQDIKTYILFMMGIPVYLKYTCECVAISA